MLSRAIAGFARLMAEMVDNRELAEGPGLLQRVDARAKVVALLGLVVAATFIHRPATLGAAYALCLALALASRVPLSRLARAWLAVPLFSAAIVLPATLNIVTPGAPLWPVWPERHVFVTAAGLMVAVRFVLRTAVCITLALLLTATTRPDRLFRGLRAIGVPRLFVMLLGMMERYLIVLLRAAEEIHLARRSRSIVPGSVREEQEWVGAGIGSVFRRTQSLGNAVFLAMLSRGYTGEARLLDDPPLGTKDAAFVLAAVAAAAVLLIWR